MGPEPSYFIAHWRGEHSLAKSVLLNGLLSYLALTAALVYVGRNVLTSQAFVYSGMAMFLAWFVWASVGISRCAIRIARSSDSSLPRKILAVLALIGLIAAVITAANDIWNLVTA
jgi:hypothetical protein